MLGSSNEFYHALLKKYTAIFGSLFNDIYVTRMESSSVEAMSFKVPLTYGPREKALAKMTEDGDKKTRSHAAISPRLTYEFVGLSYDPNRVLSPIQSIRTPEISVLNPTPYNLTFQLLITAKTIEEAARVLEQILPHFKPEYTVTAHLIDSMPEYSKDIPILLDSVDTPDLYEGSFEDRRIIIWTLTFILKGYFFGQATTPKVIKFAKVNLYPDLIKTDGLEYIEVDTYPGLTSNNEPTTDPTQTIPWANIDETDPWDYIITIEDKHV